MGQRLNIEIKSKNKVVANCYYHWSGFSLLSLKLTKKIIDGFDMCEQIESENPFSIRYKYPMTMGRDEGLIEIDEKNMEENRKWEEGRITIDIDNKTFDFDVLLHISKEEVEEDYSNEKWEDSIQLKNIPFSEIDNYISKIESKENNKDYNFKIDDDYCSIIA